MDFLEFNSCTENGEKIQASLEKIKVNDFEIHVVDNILNNNEIAYLLDKKNLNLDSESDSPINPSSNIHDYRKSKTLWFKEENENQGVIKCLKQRFATIGNKNVENIEPLQLTQYQNGDFYKTHSDLIGSKDVCTDPLHPSHDKLCTPENEQVNREKTIFVVLDTKNLEEEACGGGTIFNNIKSAKDENVKLRIAPRIGRAIVWNNLTDDNERHPLSMHSGEELRCLDSRKIGMNVWINDQMSNQQIELKNKYK